MSQLDELIRALDYSGMSATLPKEVDAVIAQLVDYQNPLRMNMPRKPGSGDAWYVNRRSAGNTAGTFVDDTDSLTEDTGTYAQASFLYKTIGVQIKVTRKAQATGRKWRDVLADELEAKIADFKDKDDYSLLWGQKTASTPISGLGSAKEFDGLNALCPAGNVVKVTTAAAGGALTLELLDEALDKCRGGAKMIITSRAGRRKINALLQSYQRFNDKIEVKGGFRVLGYDDVPIFTSTNISESMTYSGSDISALTGATTTAIFIVNTDKTFLGELTPLKAIPLAKTSSQYDLIDIVEDVTLVSRDVYSIVKVVGIKV